MSHGADHHGNSLILILILMTILSFMMIHIELFYIYLYLQNYHGPEAIQPLV